MLCLHGQKPPRTTPRAEPLSLVNDTAASVVAEMMDPVGSSLVLTSPAALQVLPLWPSDSCLDPIQNSRT